jgi:hypothetical protein
MLTGMAATILSQLVFLDWIVKKCMVRRERGDAQHSRATGAANRNDGRDDE